MISQLPFKLRYETIGDLTLSDAILDGHVHKAHRIDVKGESMRQKRSLKLDYRHQGNARQANKQLRQIGGREQLSIRPRLRALQLDKIIY